MKTSKGVLAVAMTLSACAKPAEPVLAPTLAVAPAAKAPNMHSSAPWVFWEGAFGLRGMKPLQLRTQAAAQEALSQRAEALSIAVHASDLCLLAPAFQDARRSPARPTEIAIALTFNSSATGSRLDDVQVRCLDQIAPTLLTSRGDKGMPFDILFAKVASLRGIGITKLASLPLVPSNIEVLAVGSEFTDKDASALSRFLDLRSLHLGKTKVGDAGLAHLSNLKSLQSLHLSGTKRSVTRVAKHSG